jgi:cytochrome c-type protein NapC
MSIVQKIKTAGPLVAALCFVAGIVAWGGFNWSLELTNTEQFCISCHEMRDNVFVEYQTTIHYSNRTGVRATCPDCHVPKEWVYKMKRKIQASNELWHHLLGSVDTPEKFNAKRAQLAQNEWARMKATDSRECRNCHNYDYMDYAEQGKRAVKAHPTAFEEGKTCIDCHKGVAHALPPIDQDIGARNAGEVKMSHGEKEGSAPPAVAPVAPPAAPEAAKQ